MCMHAPFGPRQFIRFKCEFACLGVWMHASLLRWTPCTDTRMDIISDLICLCINMQGPSFREGFLTGACYWAKEGEQEEEEAGLGLGGLVAAAMEG